jgi:hypothetical protein
MTIFMTCAVILWYLEHVEAYLSILRCQKNVSGDHLTPLKPLIWETTYIVVNMGEFKVLAYKRYNQCKICMQALNRRSMELIAHGDSLLLKCYSVRVDFAGREFQNG